MKISNIKLNFKKIASLCLTIGIAFFPINSSALNTDGGDPNDDVIKMIFEEATLSFDESLKRSGVSSQKNELWKDWKLANNRIFVGDGGCGPLSITNAISLAFGISDEKEISEMLKNIISLNSKYRGFNEYILGSKNIENYSKLNALKKSISEKVINGGSGSKSLLSKVEQNSEKIKNGYCILGLTAFDASSFKHIIQMIIELYKNNPDTNIIFYNMSGGILLHYEPFGSISDSGHYVTLLINVREFVENDSLYLIDSLPRNLSGEKKHKKNYNFVEKPNAGGLKKFNDNYSVLRISDEILKITKKTNEIDSKSLALLGLDGGCGVIICQDNITLKKTDMR